MSSKRIPRKISGYDIERKLASGGMGEVLLGRHQVLDRPVALKRLVSPDDAAPDRVEELQERFLREGRVLAQLSHQTVCGVYDLFTWRSTLYIALEYIDGYDLTALLKHGALPLDVALIIAANVADGLDHAHVNGIVHRDVKPSNVMVSRKGEVKLMDFGIAKGDAMDGLTRTGMVVGTPSYMAPEVLRGQEAGPKADVYSLGATLYRCMAGRPLFKKAAPELVYRQILKGQIPKLRKVQPSVPRAVAAEIHKALALDPRRRHADAAELHVALLQCLAVVNAPRHHEQRLIQFLFADGHMSAEDALTVVAPEVLEASKKTRVVKRERSPSWGWLAAGLLVTTIGLGGLWTVGTGSLEGVVEQVIAWLDAGR